MSPDLAQTAGVTPERTAHCPSCGAGVRADAPWCTQCFFDLRPAPEPEPPPPVTAPRLPPAAAAYPDPLTDPLPDGRTEPTGIGPTWPCTTCGMHNDLAAAACSACGSGFLAALREGEAPLLVLPGVGDLSRYGRAQRLGLAAGVAVAFVLLILVVGVLFS